MSNITRLFHPLCGSNPATLLRLLASNGPLALDRSPQAAIALAVTLLRWPFSAVERVATELLRRRRPAMPAPVFIVGYWRSGTTHLHNVLSQDEAFGYISPLATGLPWDVLGIVRLFEPLLKHALPRDRYVDNVAVTPDSPQEDSIALSNMLPLSYYHGLYFPRRFSEHFKRGVFFEGCRPEEIDHWRCALVHFLTKVFIQQKGKRLLIKNPVYTGHVGKLRDIWPQAKFIHIYRNPYALLPSARHFFTRLLPELALQPYDGLDIDTLILQSYPRMMNTLAADAARLPPTSFVEVRFEDFETDALPELRRIYETLELPGWDGARPRFQRYLSQVRGYRKNHYAFDAPVIRSVDAHWGSYVRRFGYSAPAPASNQLN